jgi:RNA polymerase sigma factor (sigma-70 family)
MHDKSDIQLLRDYAERGSDAAFHDLVTRHTDFVYSAALRLVDSSDLACDVAQSVFTDLARKARPLAERMPGEGSLAGWLHRSTRYAALNLLRDTRRRLANERQAMEQLLANSESSPDWERIRPALDEALDSLCDEDREALLLRYFKNHDFRAVGFALNVSDDAAQKRASRAVERLREFFAKRGVTVGASGLVVVISTNAVQAAPIGLAVTISTASTLPGTTFATSTLTKGILLMTLTKQKVAIAAIIALWLVIGGTTALLLNRSHEVSPPGMLPSSLLRTGFEVRWVATDGDTNSTAEVLPGAGTRTNHRGFRVLKDVLLDNSDVEGATFSTDQAEGHELLVLLNEKGGRKFADATAGNIGRQLAIVWNGCVVNAPIIRSAILGQKLKVTGAFSEAEARMLLDALNHR